MTKIDLLENRFNSNLSLINRGRSILREKLTCEFKVCVYFWQLVPWPVQEQKINTMPERPICEFTVCIYFWQLVPWLVQEQKINTIQFDWSSSIDLRGSDLWVQGLGIFLTASSLAGARAKDKHDRVWERVICEYAFAYIFDSYSALAGPRAKHKHDWVQSIFDFSERPIYEFKVCVYFW